MSWIYSIGIFIGIILAGFIITYLGGIICDLLDIDGDELIGYLFLLIIGIMIIIGIHEIVVS